MRFTKFEFISYLERINCDLDPESFNLSLGTMTDIHKLHTENIPFENFDIHLGNTISIEQADIFKKLVLAKRGGYCYETNELLALVLEYLGFKVHRSVSRVLFPAVRSLSHMILLVQFDGQFWLLDSGFSSNSLRRPIALPEEDNFNQDCQDIDNYKLSSSRDQFDNIQYMLQVLISDTWVDLYSFNLIEALPIDFEQMSYSLSNMPSSPFVKYKICAKSINNRRFTLINNELKIRTKDRTIKLILNEKEYVETLHDRFNISFSESEQNKLLKQLFNEKRAQHSSRLFNARLGDHSISANPNTPQLPIVLMIDVDDTLTSTLEAVTHGKKASISNELISLTVELFEAHPDREVDIFLTTHRSLYYLSEMQVSISAMGFSIEKTRELLAELTLTCVKKQFEIQLSERINRAITIADISMKTDLLLGIDGDGLGNAYQRIKGLEEVLFAINALSEDARSFDDIKQEILLALNSESTESLSNEGVPELIRWLQTQVIDSGYFSDCSNLTALQDELFRNLCQFDEQRREVCPVEERYTQHVGISMLEERAANREEANSKQLASVLSQYSKSVQAIYIGDQPGVDSSPNPQINGAGKLFQKCGSADKQKSALFAT